MGYPIVLPAVNLVLRSSLFLLLLVGGAFAAEPVPADPMKFDILPQPLGTALNEFAWQSDRELLFSTSVVQNKDGRLVAGVYEPEEALGLLLADTGLKYSVTTNETFLVDQAQGPESSRTRRPVTMAQASEKGSGNAAPGRKDGNRPYEEIMVTATKRAVGLQDVAASITALGNEEIERRGLVGMGDYLNSIPGVSVLDQAAGYTSIVMRGIAANPQLDGSYGPTVGVYFGEVPISGLGVKYNNADVKMVDIERVEVLRGPQGTLYGSSNLGGTVRNIPVAPDLREFEGHVKAGYSNTAGLGADNNQLEAVLNVPVVEDELALRVVGYHFTNSGIYGNVGSSDPAIAGAVETYGASSVERGNVGNDEYIGGRVSALWQPVDDLRINLTYLHQEIDQDGWPQADLDLGTGTFLQRRFNLRHAVGAPGFGDPEFSEGYTDNIDIANAMIEYDFGWATILSSTAYVDEKSEIRRDLASFFGFIPWSQPLDHGGEVFVEELRMASQFKGPLQLVAGLYYEKIDKSIKNWGLWGGDPELNPFADQIVLVDSGTYTSTDQLAIFGEASYALTDKLELTLGARAFTYDKEQTQIANEAAFNSVASTVTSKSEEDNINYKAALDYTPNNSALLYASWSQGFRLGSPIPAETNPVCDQDSDGFYDGSGGVTTGPRQINSDFVDSYELGGKFSLLEDRIQINMSLYQVDWNGIPIGVLYDFCGTTLNAGKARSRGVEFENFYHVGDALLVNFSASYVEAELTEDAPLLGSAGDRLPGAPEHNLNLGVQYDFFVGGNNGFVRGDYSYAGGFYNNLQETGPEIGDYGKLNLRAGLMMDRLNFEVFANNVTNEDSFIWIDAEGFSELRAYHLRPRTVGLNMRFDFW